MKPDKRMRTAYHEAGHAVACIKLRRPFAYVTIRGSSVDETEGHLQFPASEVYPADNKMERECVISAAGSAAEVRLLGPDAVDAVSTVEFLGMFVVGCSSDMDDIRRHGIDDALIAVYEKKAAALVADAWPGVVALADALLTGKPPRKIGEREARRIVLAALES